MHVLATVHVVVEAFFVLVLVLLGFAAAAVAIAVMVVVVVVVVVVHLVSDTIPLARHSISQV